MKVARKVTSREANRARAIGLIEGGVSQGLVAKKLNVTRTTVNHWWKRHLNGESLTDKKRTGRPPVVSKIAKIVCSKAKGKRGHSVRKLATRLSRKGYQVSKSTVHRFLRQSKNFYPYKRPRQPKITEKQRRCRLQFCKKVKGWTFNEFKNVIWSDESVFEVQHAPNPQNDRVWAESRDQVPPVHTVKQPAKLMVWGAMSAEALSELHIIPRNQTVNTEYYVSKILEGSLLPALNRSAETGTATEKKMVETKSEAIFMQDGAPSHTSKRTQNWCATHVPGFWDKETWPGNSPDLNPMENLWSIMKQSLDEQEPSTSLTQLERRLKAAWRNISADTLRDLVASMPSRVQKCAKLNGGYTDM